MSKTFKIVIPMGGYATRMRPQTWNRPKPLLSLAGKTVLDHSLDQFNSLPNLENAEYVFIITPNQGNMIQEYMRNAHPKKVVHFVVQEQMQGQSHALVLAKEYLTGPLLVAFSDTLIQTDLPFLESETADGVAWVKPMEDPRRFGIIKTDEKGWATILVEKPKDIIDNMVVVGFYYFRNGEKLIDAIEEQIRRKKSLKNEYFLADAINILLENGAKFKIKQVDSWLDAGIPEALLETNRLLLDRNGGSSLESLHFKGCAIIPPVSISDGILIENSVIGPHVTLGEDCVLKNVVICNSIVDAGSKISNKVIEGSLIGKKVILEGKPEHLNVGDDSLISG
jgi:glucose-1-phosphate thymidylyltransferase